jgi:rSAM/selenodomain-associated transferase 1
VVIAKAPRPGHSKTRLCPPLDAAQAADLARAFLQDTVDLALRVVGATVTVFHPGDPGAATLLRRLVPEGVAIMAQQSRGLGPGLIEAAARHFTTGAASVLLLDSDSPSLPLAHLDAARAALREHDAVLGPCEDGGYYLLGLRAPQPGLFTEIAWSTPAVVAQTRARARALDLSMPLLPCWYDVDDGAALRRLCDDLTRDASVAPHTRDCLARSMGEGG